MRKNCVNHAEMNNKVYFKTSTLPQPQAGNGLFANEDIPKESLFCTYGGFLIDPAEAKYLSPVYTVNFELGRGWKLIGDDTSGDLGHYANAVHPAYPLPKQNAKFVMGTKKVFPCGTRGWFYLKALSDIKKNEEIFVNYGAGYWTTMEAWELNPIPIEKPLTVQNRDIRTANRSVVKLAIAQSVISNTTQQTTSSIKQSKKKSVVKAAKKPIKPQQAKVPLRKTRPSKKTAAVVATTTSISTPFVDLTTSIETIETPPTSKRGRPTKGTVVKATKKPTKSTAASRKNETTANTPLILQSEEYQTPILLQSPTATTLQPIHETRGASARASAEEIALVERVKKQSAVERSVEVKQKKKTTTKKKRH